MFIREIMSYVSKLINPVESDSLIRVLYSKKKTFLIILRFTLTSWNLLPLLIFIIIIVIITITIFFLGHI